eukprot:30977-Pelagococcus_subviridis.AAC.5
MDSGRASPSDVAARRATESSSASARKIGRTSFGDASSGASVVAAMTICPTSAVSPACVLPNTNRAIFSTALARVEVCIRAKRSRIKGEYIDDEPMR